MTSLYDEPFGKVNVEAMAFGKTLLAYDTGSIREIITDGDNGYIIPRHNTDALAEKIVYLDKNREILGRIGNHARALALEKYHFRPYINNLEQVIDSVSTEG